MKMNNSRIKLSVLIGVAFLAVGGIVAYATVFTGNAAYLGLWRGPSQIYANDNNVTARGVTGGWHYHAGFAYNVVKQGTVIVEDGCSNPDDADPEAFGTRTYGAGQAFETADGRVHRAVNPDGDIDEVEISMTIVPQGGRPRVPASGSLGKRCGPARSVTECKAYWERFDFPSAFANQGECIAYVKQRPTVTLLSPEDPLQ